VLPYSQANNAAVDRQDVIPIRDENPRVHPPAATIALISLNALAWVLLQGFGTETALSRSPLLGARDRMTLLDWWATALDREAQSRPVDRRRVVFERIGARMEEELRQDPGSWVANYWLAVALRGAGDVEGAWSAAVAAWVRSTLSPETTAELRADLDRLVMQALVPERSRVMAVRDPQEAVSALRAEWELLKQQWK